MMPIASFNCIRIFFAVYFSCPHVSGGEPIRTQLKVLVPTYVGVTPSCFYQKQLLD